MPRERVSIPRSEPLEIDEQTKAERAAKEQAASGVQPLENRRVISVIEERPNGAERRVLRGVSKEDAWQEDIPEAGETLKDGDIKPIEFSDAELEEINKYHEGVEARLAAAEAKKAISKTATGVLERLVPSLKLSRLSSLDSIRARFKSAADSARGVLSEALRFAAERLGVARRELRNLENRADEVLERHNGQLADLYSGEIPQETDEQRRYAEALADVDAIYNGRS